MSVPPGWFPDPAGTVDTYRWWDGQGWTRWLGADPQAGAPAPDDPPDESADGGADEGAERAGSTETVAPSAIGDRTSPDHWRIPLAIALVVGVLVVSLVVVGLTVVLTEDRIRTGPALPPPSSTAEDGVVYDRATRNVRVQNVRMTLAAAPYTCAAEPKPITQGFRSAIACDTVIHRDYAGTDDWYATTGFGVVAESQVVGSDPTQTAQTLYRTLLREAFTDGKPTLKNFGRLRLAAIPEERGLFVGGDVHYSIEGLPSSYDRMVLGVFPLPDGDYAAFFSIRPQDTPKSTLDVLNASIATLQAG